jgi:hypothetical protein
MEGDSMSIKDKSNAYIAHKREMGIEKPTGIKKKRGRPRKEVVDSKKRGNRGTLGRPKGDAAIINEYKARMLASPKSEKVMESIYNAALNDDHKHQAAAWKLVMDRILPVAAFEQDVVKGGGKNAIQINITGIGATIEASKDEDETIVSEQ